MARKKSKGNQQQRRSLFFAVAAVFLCILGALTFGDTKLPLLEDILQSVVSLTGMPVSAPTTTQASGELAVHFIDVGQGDCILIQAGEQSILVDAGERGNGETIIQYLNRYHIQQLDLAVATHPHSDHIGSMPEVLSEFGAKELLFGNVPESLTPTTRIYEKLLDTTEEQNIPIKDALPGMEYTFDNGAHITVVGPVPGKAEDLNNTSVVFRLDFGETSFLFTGDAEMESEREILSGSYREKLDADVLKLGHHGSNTSTSQEWLDKVQPSVAVALVGKDNDYGHPHKEVLERLSAKDITLYRSDLQGNLIFTSDGTTITTETQR